MSYKRIHVTTFMHTQTEVVCKNLLRNKRILKKQQAKENVCLHIHACIHTRDINPYKNKNKVTVYVKNYHMVG